MASHNDRSEVLELPDRRGSKHIDEEANIAVDYEESPTSSRPDSVKDNAIRQQKSSEVPPSQPSLHLPLVIVLAGAAFLNTLAVQTTVIILPSIGRDLNIPSGRQQWIIGAYYLTFGCFLLLWGRLADIHGRRIIFLCGSAWLTAVTIAAPFARYEIVFDLLRGMQGLGAAANVPTAIGILGATFPPGKQKNYAFSIYSAGSSLGSVLGNLAGGFIGQLLGWRWVFWILAILAALVTVVGHFIIPVPPTETGPAAQGKKTDVDWIGGTVCTTSLLLLTFALTEGNVVGWSTPWIYTSIIVAALMLGAFVYWEHVLEHKLHGTPLIRISIFRNVRFSAAQIIMLTAFASFNNYLIFATYFYQDYLALSLIQTTLRFIPTGIFGLIGNIIAAFALSRIRGNYLLIYSTTLISLSSLLFALPIPPSTSYWAYGFLAMCFCTLGVDTLHPTLNLFTVQALPKEDQALGGGLITAMLQIGRTIGLAIATAIQTATMGQEKAGSSMDPAPKDPGLLKGLRAAHWFDFALAIAALGVVACFFRGKEKVGKIAK